MRRGSESTARAAARAASASAFAEAGGASADDDEEEVPAAAPPIPRVLNVDRRDTEEGTNLLSPASSSCDAGSPSCTNFRTR